jgi:ornithine cyclodeaminase
MAASALAEGGGMSGEIRVIKGALVQQLLDMESCIAAMRQAFSMISAGRAEQPVRSAIQVPGHGLLGLMPGRLIEPASLGIKLVTVYPGNFANGKPSHMGMLLLFDPEDGSPRAMIDAHAVTMIRTAAASAVATDLLARPDASRVALLGYGDQAVSHLQAIRLVRPLDQILIWGRDRAKAEAFAARHGALVAASVEEALSAADIICTLTASYQPILPGASLRAGQHVNAVGASLPVSAELDSEAVRRSRFFCDYRPGAEAQAGEWRNALAAGVVTPDHLLGEIGQIINREVAGRLGPSDITCFKSLGMAVEDLVAGELILARAEAAGLGQMVEL